MDEIEQRLKDASERCISAYEGWAKSKKDAPLREKLQDAIHELRKVTSRLEIEIAVSEREDMAHRPIPIPPHRSSRPRASHENMPDFLTVPGGGQPQEELDDAQPSFGGGEGGASPEARRRPGRRPPYRPQGGNNGNG